MPITVDQASLGTVDNNASSSTAALTTTNAVASAGFIVVAFVAWHSPTVTLSSVADNGAGGSLTWVVDGNMAASADHGNVGLARAYAPAGRASGIVITGTYSGATTAKGGAAMSFLSVASASPLDGSVVTKTNAGSTALTGGSVTAALSGDLVVTACVATGAGQSMTVTTGTEAFDFDNTGNEWLGLIYNILPGAGPVNNAATLAASQPWATVSAAYKFGAASSISPAHAALPFQGQGRNL